MMSFPVHFKLGDMQISISYAENVKMQLNAQEPEIIFFFFLYTIFENRITIDNMKLGTT